MATSRRGLTGITFAVSLGVAVTTDQGVAHADSAGPGSPQTDPPSTATTPASTDGPVSQDADGGQGAERTEPLAKKRPRSLFDGTQITIRRENAKAAAKDDGKPTPTDDAAAEDDTDPPVEQTAETLRRTTFESAPIGTKARGSATRSRSTTGAVLASPPRTMTIGVPNRNVVSALDTEGSPERRTATFTTPEELEAATSLQLRQTVSTFDMDRIAIHHVPADPLVECRGSRSRGGRCSGRGAAVCHQRLIRARTTAVAGRPNSSGLAAAAAARVGLRGYQAHILQRDPDRPARRVDVRGEYLYRRGNRTDRRF